MATAQATIDDLLDRLTEAGPVTARKMFGEYCVYLDAKPVALVCDGTLYVKPTAAGRAAVPDVAEGPPYPGAKPHLMFPQATWADHNVLCRVLRATFEALPQAARRRKSA